ncbi:MAG: metallophosphoesterase, partial [Thermodesulfobacteriota bacterium]
MRKVLVILTFFVVILSAWIGGHVYMVRRLVLDPGLTGVAADLAIAAFVVLGASIVPQWLAERYLAPRHARLVAWPAFLWMGLAFFLVLALAVSDAVLA